MSETCVNIYCYYLHACMWLVLTQLELGSASPQQFKAVEMSWEAGHSALDFILALLNGPVKIRMHNTPYLCYSGYVKPYSSFLRGFRKPRKSSRPTAAGRPQNWFVSVTWGRKLNGALNNQGYHGLRRGRYGVMRHRSRGRKMYDFLLPYMFYHWLKKGYSLHV